MQCRVFHNNLTHRTSEIHDIHLFKVCHGDIKLENILITSWNWVLLADFASFKPTYLPEDNPGDYSYFFDASRRRTCYIAPERFVFNYCLIHRSVIHKFSSATV
jgi:serine/threonine protein kinase